MIFGHEDEGAAGNKNANCVYPAGTINPLVAGVLSWRDKSVI